MRVVTYCDSPEFILELFDRVETLEHLEVVVGDIEDYRERLIDKPELADRLEQLKRDGQLVIYLCENKEVHSKVYLVEYGPVTGSSEEQGSAVETSASDDESSQQTLGTVSTESQQKGEKRPDQETESADARNATAIIGSPNLSKNAWTRQANAGVVSETTTTTDLWANLTDFYAEHRDYNNDGPFLDDLTERLANTNDDREDVVTLFTEGKVKTRDEVGQLHGRLDERVEDEIEKVDLVLGDDIELSEGAEAAVAGHATSSDAGAQTDETSSTETGKEATNLNPSEQTETRINLSLVGHSDEAIETLSKMTDFDASFSGDSLTATPRAVQQYKRDVFEVPTMRIDRAESDESRSVEFGDHINFHADGQVYKVGQPLPDDKERVNAALEGIEDYFGTVDKYGNCNDPDAVKAHHGRGISMDAVGSVCQPSSCLLRPVRD
jgi:hypothetical protein